MDEVKSCKDCIFYGDCVSLGLFGDWQPCEKYIDKQHLGEKEEISSSS